MKTKTKRVNLSALARDLMRDDLQMDSQELRRQLNAVTGRWTPLRRVYNLRSAALKVLGKGHTAKRAPSPQDLQKLVKRAKELPLKVRPSKEPEPMRFTAEEVVLGARVVNVVVSRLRSLFVQVGDRERAKGLVEMSMQALYPHAYNRSEGIFESVKP